MVIKNKVTPIRRLDGGVVGTVGGGFSGGNKGGVTDEGVIVGGLPNADDGSASNGGTTIGTGAGAGTSTGDSTSTDTKTDTGETGTMTYEEFIAEQKAREEEKRQAALKEAEIYKERAAADAQASYMQNMSTYGVNAETMAQMGLTGGGYSDYLNAQAYAQKRGEMQTASANEAAMKQQAESKYADNILSLDGQLVAYKEAEKAEEEKAAAEEEQKATYSAGLKSDAMAQIEANGGVSVDYINSLKTYGLSDEDMAYIIAYNQKYTYNSYKSAITDGYTVNTSDIDAAYSEGRLDGKQYKNLKSEWNKSIDTSTTFFEYNGETISYEDAKKAMKILFNNSWTTSEIKEALESSFDRVYKQNIIEEQGDSSISAPVVGTGPQGSGFGGGGFGAR